MIFFIFNVTIKKKTTFVNVKMDVAKPLAYSDVEWASKIVNAIDAMHKITIDNKAMDFLQFDNDFWLDRDDNGISIIRYSSRIHRNNSIERAIMMTSID